MPDIESTPAMATRVYATMARNLEVVRRRLRRPLTLADKVLLGHLEDPERQALEPGRSDRSGATCCTPTGRAKRSGSFTPIARRSCSGSAPARP